MKALISKFSNKSTLINLSKSSGTNKHSVNDELIKERFIKKEIKPMTDDEVESYRLKAYKAIY